MNCGELSGDTADTLAAMPLIRHQVVYPFSKESDKFAGPCCHVRNRFYKAAVPLVLFYKASMPLVLIVCFWKASMPLMVNFVMIEVDCKERQ